MKESCDLLVIGSGAAGLAAAVTAAHHGLRVIVAEKAPVLGGTTAWSGGWIWAPGNPVCARTGTMDSPKAAETYLRAALGPDFDAPRAWWHFWKACPPLRSNRAATSRIPMATCPAQAPAAGR